VARLLELRALVDGAASSQDRANVHIGDARAGYQARTVLNHHWT